MTANFRIAGCLIVVLIALPGLGYNFPKVSNFREVPSFREVVAKPRLSDYAFFSGNIADLSPAPGVFPYEVNAPLFSDYAEKARFVFLPDGQKMEYDAEKAFAFPVGAVLIKNFFYWNDARTPEKGRRILETRLLLKDEKGWKALEYLWNAEQTDAFLEVAGASFPFSWLNAKGKKMNIEYTAPNLNQCKGCHSYDGQFVPIGLSARQLNREENGENQLLHWQKSGKLTLPPDFDPQQAPRLADYRVLHPPINQLPINQSPTNPPTPIIPLLVPIWMATAPIATIRTVRPAPVACFWKPHKQTLKSWALANLLWLRVEGVGAAVLALFRESQARVFWYTAWKAATRVSECRNWGGKFHTMRAWSLSRPGFGS